MSYEHLGYVHILGILIHLPFSSTTLLTTELQLSIYIQKMGIMLPTDSSGPVVLIS